MARVTPNNPLLPSPSARIIRQYATPMGHRAALIPANSRLLGPMQPGDQGVSSFEAKHAHKAMKALLQKAAGVQMVAYYDAQTGEYIIKSRTGLIAWLRYETPSGQLIYKVTRQSGVNPLPSVDPTIVRTLEEEIAAAGGAKRPVPHEKNSYPDMLRRITQLFDHSRAPDFVYIPGPGADPNHPGEGSHGIPDMVQSRAPLIMAGPGIKAGHQSEALVKHEDIAPTVAEFLGVSKVAGSNGTSVERIQQLKWQDGKSLTASLVDGAQAAAGVQPHADQAMVIVVDGMHQPVMLDEMKKGNLPNIQRIMQSGTLFRNGTIANYPTVTWANHNTIVTGASPGHSGVLNNSWYDRETGTERLITDGGIKNSLRTGRLVDDQVETLYEAVERSFPGARTVAVNQPAGRGADISTLDIAGVGSILWNLPRIAINYLRGNSTSRDKELQSDKAYKKNSVQDNLAASLGEVYWSKSRPPKLGVFEFTLVDNQGHNHGPQAEQARRALRESDRNIGRILKTLDDRGITDSTMIVLTADHGMETQYTDKSKLGGWFKALKNSGVKTVESTRFVYVKSLRAALVAPVPAAGQQGSLVLKVSSDDVDTSGSRPAIEGARVVVTDADGNRWQGATNADGTINVAISPQRGPLKVEIQHDDFTTETLQVPLGR